VIGHKTGSPAFIRQRDPRVRMALAIVLSLGLSFLQQLSACCLGLILALLLLLGSRPPLRSFLNQLIVVNSFVLFLWLVTPLTVPGTPLMEWGPFTISREGVELTALVSLKANAISCIFLALVGSMEISTAAYALERLRCPRKIVFLFLFTARHVHLLAQEWRNLHTAALLRGFQPKSNLHSYKTIASLLGILLVRSHERGKRVREAMLLRGFTGRLRSVGIFRIGAQDIGFALAMLAGLTGIFLAEWAGQAYV
jgi:cobalt/nickel transport system permease protein